jgi:gas vesicle protein
MSRNYNNENGDTRRRVAASNTTDKLTYLLVGGGIGALVALLFAPKAGQELRGDIADVTRKGYDKTLETAQQLKEQSGTYYQQIKGQAGDVYNTAADRLKGVSQQTGNDLQKTANKALDTAKQTGDQLGDAARETATNITDTQNTSQHSI